MIHLWDSDHAVAVMADGKVSIGSCNNDSVTWANIQGFGKVTAKKVCVQTGSLAILTSDNRILVSLDPQERLRSITASIHRITGPATIIKDIFSHRQTIIIITSDTVALADVKRKWIAIDKHKDTISVRIAHRFSCEIDLWSEDWSWDWGAVRTRDNRLYRISKDDYIDHSSFEEQPACWITEELVFHDSSSISEITGSLHTMFLLMDDGRVYAQKVPAGFPHGSNKAFQQVLFLDGESVVKIVPTIYVVFFITAEGRCYQSQKGLCRGPMVPQIQLQSLREYFVEDIRELRCGCAVRHSNGSLCILHTSLVQDKDICVAMLGPCVQETFEQYVSGTGIPRPIPFFDDKSVVSIWVLFGRIYFVTDEGHVFWAQHFDETMEPIITRDTYFDTNPLAVKIGTQTIRSAGSTLDDN